MTVAIREADASDRRFVISSWLDSFRNSYNAGLIGMSDWWAVMHPQIEKVLDRAGVRTLVAYETREKDRVADLYGFITFDSTVKPTMVFYVYVKAPYRRAGYRNGKRVGDGHARILFAAAGIDPLSPFDYACKTQDVAALSTKIPRARWQPLLARETDPARRNKR